jgi:hypothetical protein
LLLVAGAAGADCARDGDRHGAGRGMNRPRSRAGREATGEWCRASTEEVPERAA